MKVTSAFTTDLGEVATSEISSALCLPLADVTRAGSDTRANIDGGSRRA